MFKQFYASHSEQQYQHQKIILNISGIQQDKQISISNVNSDDIDIDIRAIQFPDNQSHQQQQINDDQSSGLPYKGSFLQQMQRLCKTIIFENKRYNIYHNSLLESSINSSMELNLSNILNQEKIQNKQQQKKIKNLKINKSVKSSKQMFSSQLKLNQQPKDYMIITQKYILDFTKNKKKKMSQLKSSRDYMKKNLSKRSNKEYHQKPIINKTTYSMASTQTKNKLQIKKQSIKHITTIKTIRSSQNYNLTEKQKVKFIKNTKQTIQKVQRKQQRIKKDKIIKK